MARTTATKHFHNRIALFFDFGRTLAPSSYNTLLACIGIEPEVFRKERVQPLSEAGWDDTLAYFYTLIQASKSRDDLTTRASRNCFDRVREWAEDVLPGIKVRFYLLSCGFADVQRDRTSTKRYPKKHGTSRSTRSSTSATGGATCPFSR